MLGTTRLISVVGKIARQIRLCKWLSKNEHTLLRMGVKTYTPSFFFYYPSLLSNKVRLRAVKTALCSKIRKISYSVKNPSSSPQKTKLCLFYA